MFTANAFVIYFTIGVPFGVLSIYLSKSRLTAIKAGWFAAHLALWPAFAAKTLVTSFSQPLNETSNPFSIQNDLRSRFESIIPAAISANKRRTMLFEFDRFIALSESAAEAHQDAGTLAMPVHSIGRHPFPLVAAKCLNRKLLSQLSRHQMDAYLSIYNSADEQGINLPSAISSELKTLIDRNSPSNADSVISTDRLAA